MKHTTPRHGSVKDLREKNAKLAESQCFLRQLLACVLLKDGGRLVLDTAFYRVPKEPVILTRKDFYGQTIVELESAAQNVTSAAISHTLHTVAQAVEDSATGQAVSPEFGDWFDSLPPATPPRSGVRVIDLQVWNVEIGEELGRALFDSVVSFLNKP